MSAIDGEANAITPAQAITTRAGRRNVLVMFAPP
jgi:hypothetical protein